MKIYGNNYLTEHKKAFKGDKISKSQINSALDFAYEISMNTEQEQKLGWHRDHRTGGTHTRKSGEIFCNTFQGKLAEIVFHDFINSKEIKSTDVDFSITDKGLWDDVDLECSDYRISVKSASFGSNLLLLEKDDYNDDGKYIPNININKNGNFDYFVLVRIKSDIKCLFKTNKWYYRSISDIDRKDIDNTISSEEWYFDIPGWIDNRKFVEIIKQKQIIPKSAFLNGKHKMDASNYYVESGDLFSINDLLKELK